MAIFRFGSKKPTDKEYQVESIFVSRLPVKISEEQALTIPAVKASVELISNSIAQLPIYLYEEDKTSKAVARITDDREFFLNEEANDFEAAMTLKKKIVSDYLLYGKAYIFKANDGKLHHLPARKIQEESYTADGFTVADKKYTYQGLETVELNASQVIEIDSGTNGLLCDQGDLFTVALNSLNYQENLMKNGSLPVGVLKAASRLTEPVINRLRTSFEGLYKGVGNAGKTIILEEGLQYQNISLKPDELQMNETNKTLIAEISRVFNIPESMINSAANKYASNEANGITFLQNCLGPIINAIESGFNRKLLTLTEKRQGFYFRFDTSETVRCTEKEKIDAITSGLKGGLFSFNESRNKLDLPAAEEDYFVLSLGSVLRDKKTGKLTVLNLGQNISPQEVKPKNEDGTKNK